VVWKVGDATAAFADFALEIFGAGEVVVRRGMMRLF
jgi:hypothetical protein